jgi:hypothetical protein
LEWSLSERRSWDSANIEVVYNLRGGISMSLTTAEEIYEQVIKPLPVAERLRLVEKITCDLPVPPAESKSPDRFEWMSLRGIAPNLLAGEEAQAWVSRARREADEDRERQWRQVP